jgi:hypothetical protein
MAHKNLDKEIGAELEPAIKHCDNLVKINNNLACLLEIRDKLADMDKAENLIAQIDKYISTCEEELKISAGDLLSQAQKIVNLF